MSRKKKIGLSYFPLDVGIFNDPRIRRLNSRFGADGIAFYLYILCAAYANGYYIDYTDDFVEDAAMDLSCSTEKIGLMLDYLLSKSLLDRTLFSTVKVLSSHGIQAQFQESMKGLKREISVRSDLWLLDASETLGFVFVYPSENKSGKLSDKSGIYDDKSEIYATKENKRKESKLNKNKEINLGGDAAADDPDTESGGMPFFGEVADLIGDYARALEFYKELSRTRPTDWRAAAMAWKKEHPIPKDRW